MEFSTFSDLLKEIARNPVAWSKFVADAELQREKDDVERRRREINSKRLKALDQVSEPKKSKVLFGKATSEVPAATSGCESVEKSPDGRSKSDVVRKMSVNGKGNSPNVDFADVSEVNTLYIDMDEVTHVSESPVSVSSDIVLPNGSGDLMIPVVGEFGNNLVFLLDISLNLLRASERSLPMFYSRSPPAEWTYTYSYILSSDSEDTPLRNQKKKEKPLSADKKVGTGGVRKSKRLLEKELNVTKTGRMKLTLCFFFISNFFFST